MKRKLASIDAQLAGNSLHNRLVDTAPLFFPAVGLMVGIAFQQTLANVPGAADERKMLVIWAGLLGLCTAGVGVYLLVRKQRRHPYVPAYAAALCFAWLGALRLAAFSVPPGDDIRRLVGPDQTLATLRGRVLTAPHQRRQDWCFAPFAFSDPATTFYLKATAAQTANGWADVSGTIRMHVDGPVLDLRAGDSIEFDCWLYEFDEPTNPGQFDVAQYLARRNIYVGAAVPSRDAITRRHASRRGLFARMRSRFSEAASQALLSDTSADTPTDGLLAALLLGDRTDIDRDTYEAFRKTGLLHFISLSGLHMGIFVAMIWGLAKIAGLTKRCRAMACMIATAMFLLVVPLRAPTVRAALIVWLYCLSLLMRRRTNPLNSLCLAAIILLLIRPTQLFEAGWQLSFAAVAGILAFTGRMREFFPAQTQQWAPQPKRRRKSFPRLPGKIGGLLSTGIAAWIGGAGILLYHFFTISPLTAVWTVLVFPLVAVILIVGFAKIVLFFLLPSVSILLGLIASFTAEALIHVVEFIAKFDISTILIGHVAIWVVPAYYGLVLFAGFAPIRRPIWKRRIVFAWALLLVAYLGSVKWQRTHPDEVRLTVLDVGHGQAIVGQFPSGRTVLFDAGSLYAPDVGGRIVLPFLNYTGIGRLDTIFISHGDVDHINGIPEVVSARHVDHIYAHASLMARAGSQPTIDLLVEYLEKEGCRIEPVPQMIQARDSSIKVIWPAEDTPHPANLSDNDRSLVFSIESAGASATLCSDIEQYAQERITAAYPDLHAEVVVCPHHGSPTTLDPRFIEELTPRILICSGSRTDCERSRDMLSALAVKTFHTAENGAIRVCLEASYVLDGGAVTILCQGE